jgi:hypothetical protein
MESDEKKEFIPIIDLIFLTFGKDKIKDKEIELEAVRLYNSIKIEVIAKYSYAVDIIKGELIIYTKDSSTSQFIQFKSQKIIDAINEKLGTKLVKKLIFRVDKDKYIRKIPNNNKYYEENIDINGIEISNEEKEKIEETLNIIKDNDVNFEEVIKKSLRKLFEGSIKYNKLRKNIDFDKEK